MQTSCPASSLRARGPCGFCAFRTGRRRSGQGKRAELTFAASERVEYGWLREQLDDPEICTTEVPELRDIGEGHLVACHFSEEIPPARAEAAPR